MTDFGNILKTAIGVLLGLLAIVIALYILGKMFDLGIEANAKVEYQACDEKCFHPDQCTPVAYSFRHSCICDCEGNLVERKI